MKTHLHTFHRICIYCGSNPGANHAYIEAAREMGALLAREGIELVYGGGATGVMGALADAALEAGGRVIGVIPESMNVPNVVHEGLSELHVMADMHTRKALMGSLSDAFIALPGGLGTLDELFETLTWSQLGYRPKPVGALNVAGYYDPLIALIDHAVEHGFIRPQHRHVLAVATSPRDLLDKLQRFRHPHER
ncbi:MAG: TIGR00730 family Rossman fold protein [Chloroflexi bacterium]|nr:TIGR00730 family Rossman fold protein [Chloroflexota bacterium]